MNNYDKIKKFPTKLKVKILKYISEDQFYFINSEKIILNVENNCCNLVMEIILYFIKNIIILDPITIKKKLLNNKYIFLDFYKYGNKNFYKINFNNNKLNNISIYNTFYNKELYSDIRNLNYIGIQNYISIPFIYFNKKIPENIELYIIKSDYKIKNSYNNDYLLIGKFKEFINKNENFLNFSDIIKKIPNDYFQYIDETIFYLYNKYYKNDYWISILILRNPIFEKNIIISLLI